MKVKRSRSHHHHHHDHRHHDHHDRAHISQEELDKILERERQLREANETLTRENNNLKTNLQNADAEARRLQGWIGPLQEQNQALVAENKSLRRSIDNAGEHSLQHHREAEKLRHKIHKLERDNGELSARVRELSRRVQDVVSDRIAELLDAVDAWKRKFESSEDRFMRLRRDYEDQAAIVIEHSDRVTVYERILRRHGLLY